MKEKHWLLTVLVLAGLPAGCAATKPFSMEQIDTIDALIQVEVRRQIQASGCERLSGREQTPAQKTMREPLEMHWVRGEQIDLSAVTLTPHPGDQHFISPTNHKDQWHSYLNVPGIGNVGCWLKYDCLRDLYHRTDNEQTGRTDEACVDKHICWKLVSEFVDPSQKYPFATGM